MTDTTTPAQVIDFWEEAGAKAWFSRNPAFDDRFRTRFEAAHMAAARRELDHWLETPEGALALMVLLDQFPRNSYRGTAHMFATDALALTLARKALEMGHDEHIQPALRLFLYLPFEHSENLADQQRAVALCEPLGEPFDHYARVHLDVIERFGRFPHRNAAFGRETTAAEQAFLDAGGFSG